MSRYRIFVPVTTSLLNEVGTGVVSQTATQVVVSNSDHPTTNPISPACDFLCHIAEQELIAEAAE